MLYEVITRLPNKYRSFQSGGFYDLMWVNQQLIQFSGDRIYTFLRYYDTEVMLVAVNFSNQPADAPINIPDHALKLIGAEIQENINIIDLHTNTCYTGSKNPLGDLQVTIHLTAHGYFIGNITTC